MPELSRFYGMIVYLYWKDHAPPPFHVVYGDEEVLLLIDSWQVYAGSIPSRALKMVREWAEKHKSENKTAWGEAVAGKPFKKIEPLR